MIQIDSLPYTHSADDGDDDDGARQSSKPYQRHNLAAYNLTYEA